VILHFYLSLVPWFLLLVLLAVVEGSLLVPVLVPVLLGVLLRVVLVVVAVVVEVVVVVVVAVVVGVVVLAGVRACAYGTVLCSVGGQC
jgi:hypothetical protein